MAKSLNDVPRKGNVDRNNCSETKRPGLALTFPARGTWIEMLVSSVSFFINSDVPRKRNVDRNC